jgi:hypothetical protein
LALAWLGTRPAEQPAGLLESEAVQTTPSLGVIPAPADMPAPLGAPAPADAPAP